jgi:deoxyribodipyrimidine photo-lyase
MTHPERITRLNQARVQTGDYVLYWMQAAQRIRHNEALQVAVAEADDLGLPVVVCFGLTPSYPVANWRHYRFMLQGLANVQRGLAERDISFVLQIATPPDLAVTLGQRAALVVVDRGYLRQQRAWYAFAADRLACPLLQVESNVVAPVAAASGKEEYAARTLRPRIHRRLAEFLGPDLDTWPRTPALLDVADSLDLADLEAAESALAVDRSVTPAPTFLGGEGEAQHRLGAFLDAGLDHYAERRNDPAQDGLSHLSPYLHYGQISPREIVWRAQQLGGPGADTLIEELVVRRELAINYCVHNPQYDTLAGLPDWALRTLAAHANDPRPYLYSRQEFEAGLTHDAYWNAAQREMVVTGKMHGYMRMYWGKKVIEWSATPQEAFETLVYLNDRYELDGRDPNGYAGIAWCFGKHDRPWGQRPVLGSLRYMSAAGLERKFDIAAYVARVAALRSAAFDRATPASAQLTIADDVYCQHGPVSDDH